MYRNPNTHNKRWVDPSKKAEMQERDRIRQAHYAQLEREKAVLADETLESVEVDEIQGGDVILNEDITIDEKNPPEPVYFTKMEKKGWYNVIGPAGTPVNAALLRLDAAEKKAQRMNNGANR